MDQLIEQVVPRQRNARYIVNILLILLAAVAIPATLIVIAEVLKIAYLAIIAMFVALFEIYGVWFFISSLKVEYEYAFLSSVLRIDKIIAKRRRRAVIKIDVKKLDDFFPYSDDKMTEQRFHKVYHAGAKEYSEENYVAAFHHEAKGKCAIVFTPNQALIDGMKPYFSSELRKKLFLQKK